MSHPIIDKRSLVARWRRPDAEHPAAADGERLHPGLVAQPVNTVTSIAYLVAAGRSWRVARMSVLGRAVCLTLAVNGLGSMGFHGPGDKVSHLVHDVSLWAMVTAVAADIADTAFRRPGLLRKLVGPLTTLGLGALINARSRTGRPWCRPDSLLQGHAVWHLLSAASISVLPGRTSRPEPARSG